MEKTGEMDLYLYVDGRGRMTMPRALRSRTGMGKNSFVRARLDGGVVRLTHVTEKNLNSCSTSSVRLCRV